MSNFGLGALFEHIVSFAALRGSQTATALRRPKNNEEIDGNIGWHQDYAHWQVSSSTNMATMWIALQDTNLENGGMRTIVGSHKWGLQKNADTFHEKDLKWYKCWVPAMIFHQIALKSTIKNGVRNLELIFDDIFQIAKKL